MAEPVKVELTLDLDKYLVRFHGHDADGDERVEPQTIEDIILAEAARQVVGNIGRDSLYETHRSRVAKIRDEVIREKLTPIIEEALTGPVVKTNTYGEATGQTTTLRELIMAEVGKALTMKNDAYGRNPGKTLVQEFIANEVKKEVAAELRSALDQAKAQVVAAVKNQAAAAITETITKLAGVR